MARYCFYCGRELKAGDKCGCRTTTQQQRPGQDHATGQNSHDTTRGNRQQADADNDRSKSKTGPGWWHNMAGVFRSSGQDSNTRQRHRRQPWHSRSGAKQSGSQSTSGRQNKSFRLDRKSGRVVWLQMKNLLLQPVDSINRPDSTAGNELTLFLLFLAGLLGGLFFVIGLRQPQLQQFFSLNRATVAPGTGTGTHFFLFMQGFGIGLGLTLLPAFLHHILLRLIFRQHMTLVRLITELNPAYFYTELFLLGALLVLPGSVFSAVLMLVAGFGVSALAQYLVMRRLTSFDENRCFMLIAFVLLIQTSITALLFNLSLPLLNALLDHSVVF